MGKFNGDLKPGEAFSAKTQNEEHQIRTQLAQSKRSQSEKNNQLVVIKNNESQLSPQNPNFQINQKRTTALTLPMTRILLHSEGNIANKSLGSETITL